MYKETIVGKTKQGKEIAYRVKEGDALYSIYYKHGGQMPSVLTGMWSDPRQIVNVLLIKLLKIRRRTYQTVSVDLVD